MFREFWQKAKERWKQDEMFRISLVCWSAVLLLAVPFLLGLTYAVGKSDGSTACSKEYLKKLQERDHLLSQEKVKRQDWEVCCLGHQQQAREAARKAGEQNARRQKQVESIKNNVSYFQDKRLLSSRCFRTVHMNNNDCGANFTEVDCAIVPPELLILITW